MHMTTEEKLQHFSEVSMETAREEAEKAITEYRAILDADLEQHKKEKQGSSQTTVKGRSRKRIQRDQQSSFEQSIFHIKRKLCRKQQELREQCFWKSRTC